MPIHGSHTWLYTVLCTACSLFYSPCPPAERLMS